MRTSVDICIIDCAEEVVKVIIYKDGETFSKSIFNNYNTALKFATNIAKALKAVDINEK